jgi:hypothetical protein
MDQAHAGAIDYCQANQLRMERSMPVPEPLTTISQERMSGPLSLLVPEFRFRPSLSILRRAIPYINFWKISRVFPANTRLQFSNLQSQSY